MPKRALWSEEQLKAAMNAVDTGMSVQKASELHNIPRRTLRDHISSGSRVRKLGRNPYLTQEMEDDLCARIFRLSEIGMPITGKFLRVSVFNFCLLNNIVHPFDVSKRSAGRKWLRLFLQRHPEVRARKAQHMNPGRAMKLNKFIVDDHFSKLRNVLMEKDFMTKTERIYNIDEKGCRLTVHHQQTVLARRGAKRVHLVAPEHAENVTVVACANALGTSVPPMIIFKGQRLKPEWEKDMPPGTLTVMSGKGSMTTALFIRWLDHFARYKVTGEVILIFDGASSHLDANIASAADKYGITLYCLPSNTTHELQPMDKSVFKPFETFWDDEVLLFFDRNKTSNLRKSDFGGIFTKVWSRAITPSNVQSGFRATGIYPFDPHVIPEEAFGPSVVSQAVEGREASVEGTRRDDASPDSSETEDDPRMSSLLETVPLENQSSTEQAAPHCSSTENFTRVETDRTPDQTQTTPTPFSSILSTPKRKYPPRVRRKALNYKANVITTSLFTDVAERKNNAGKKAKNSQKPPRRHEGVEPQPSTSTNSWMCFICEEDRIENMSLCRICVRYLHDKCGGIRKNTNLSTYKCPECTK